MGSAGSSHVHAEPRTAGVGFLLMTPRRSDARRTAPDHDRPADLGNYVALFETPILGLTGTEAQLGQIKRGYGVYAAKVPQPGGDYTIDHTAAIYLMTARGEFAGTIDHQESDQTALAKLRRLIG